MTAFAEVVVHIQDGQLFRFSLDITCQLGERNALAESRAEHVGIALLGNGSRLTTCEVRNLTALAFSHGNHDGARVNRTHDGEHVIVDSLLCQTFGHAGIGLSVFGCVADFATRNAACSIDFLDGQLNALFEHHA